MVWRCSSRSPWWLRFGCSSPSEALGPRTADYPTHPVLRGRRTSPVTFPRGHRPEFRSCLWIPCSTRADLWAPSLGEVDSCSSTCPQDSRDQIGQGPVDDPVGSRPMGRRLSSPYRRETVDAHAGAPRPRSERDLGVGALGTSRTRGETTRSAGTEGGGRVALPRCTLRGAD